MLILSPELQIPDSEFAFSFVRSSGPGGQNVNKVNSKAVLRWNVVESPSLGALPELRARILARLAPRLTRGGELIVASDAHRDQLRNREDCLEKLRALLLRAAERPKPRKETKPTRGSQRRAKESKRRHSEKKKLRGALKNI